MITGLCDHPGHAEFVRGFVEEHLFEIGFLLRQRREHLADPALPWAGAERIEERALAHLRALAAWGAAARAGALAALGDEDEYLVRAGAYAVAALGEGDDLAAAASLLLAAPPERLPAWEEGLRHAPGRDLSPWLSPLLAAAAPAPCVAILQALGHRGEGPAGGIAALLERGEPAVREAAAWALARRGDAPSARILEPLITADPANAAPLILPLLLLAPARALDLCRAACRGAAPAFPGLAAAIALGGEAGDAALLVGLLAARAGEPPAAVIRALGVLGAAAGVPALLEAVASADEAISAEARGALARLSGLSPETDRAGWERWWSRARGRLDVGACYRAGTPLEAAAVVAEIAAPRAALEERRRAGWEMITRFREPADFEPDAFVRAQRAAIRRWEARPWPGAARS